MRPSSLLPVGALLLERLHPVPSYRDPPKTTVVDSRYPQASALILGCRLETLMPLATVTSNPYRLKTVWRASKAHHAFQGVRVRDVIRPVC